MDPFCAGSFGADSSLALSCSIAVASIDHRKQTYSMELWMTRFRISSQESNPSPVDSSQEEGNWFLGKGKIFHPLAVKTGCHLQLKVFVSQGLSF